MMDERRLCPGTPNWLLTLPKPAKDPAKAKFLGPTPESAPNCHSTDRCILGDDSKQVECSGLAVIIGELVIRDNKIKFEFRETGAYMKERTYTHNG